MDRRLKNGLAWAGVVLVCAIPAADWLTQQFSAPKAANVSVATTDAATAPAPSAKPAVTETAAAEPVAPAPTKPRKMPSYISDAGEGDTIEAVAGTNPKPAAAAPKPTTPAPKPETAQQPPRVVPGATPPANEVAATEPKVVINAPADRGTSNVPAPVRDVASVTVPNGAVFSPDIIAPIPMPASMRPSTRPVDPVRTGNVVPPVNNTMVPVNGAGYGPDDEVISRDDIITAEDLEDWESGPLSEFLAQRQNQAGNNAPRSRYAPQAESDYDPNGFFLSDGPNVDRRPPADIVYPYGGY